MRKHYHISYRHRRIRRRDVQRAMLAIGATFLVLLIAVFLIRCWEDKTYFVDNSGIENQTEEQKEDITYKGKVYTPKRRSKLTFLWELMCRDRLSVRLELITVDRLMTLR